MTMPSAVRRKNMSDDRKSNVFAAEQIVVKALYQGPPISLSNEPLNPKP